jgi:hypothetical protein
MPSTGEPRHAARVSMVIVLLEAIRGSAQLTGLTADLAAIAARTLAFDARDRYASVDDAGRAIAQAQRRREPATAIELGGWVRARLVRVGAMPRVSNRSRGWRARGRRGRADRSGTSGAARRRWRQAVSRR